MAIQYKIVTIEDYADDTETEDALNAEGANDWEICTATFQPNGLTGKSTGIFIFKK
jgi:hypothetical protein